MDNKEKLHKKYVNQKRFLIDIVLNEIFNPFKKEPVII